MANFPASDYPKPPDRVVEDLARKLPGEIEQWYEAGPESGEFTTRFYHASDLIRLLTDTGIDASEGAAVHAIRWLVQRKYLVPFAVAVRNPDSHSLPTLEEPWLSAVLNGRLLDAIEQHGDPNPLDEHYIKRLDDAESEAYFAPAAFWEWWRSDTPLATDVYAEAESAAIAPKSENKWWATEPPDLEIWNGPVTGAQKVILQALNASIESGVTRKTLPHRHKSKALYVFRVGNGQEWRVYFRSQEEFAEVNAALTRIGKSSSSEEGR